MGQTIESLKEIMRNTRPDSPMYQDACRELQALRSGRPPLCRHCGLDVSEHSRISKACPGPVASVLKMKYYEADRGQ